MSVADRYYELLRLTGVIVLINVTYAEMETYRNKAEADGLRLVTSMTKDGSAVNRMLTVATLVDQVGNTVTPDAA